MKKILGLDLGTNSIGWALVHEAENVKESSEIIKLGVRINPLSSDEVIDFERGRPLSVNKDRTLKRGARRNLQRFKLRRKNLIDILIKAKILRSDSVLTEIGKNSTYETLQLRSKSVKQQVKKEEFARVLLAINKKRGYKSSRKSNNKEEEGNLIDGMFIAKELYNNNLTPGKYVYQLLSENKNYIPDFYQSDLKNEFLAVWTFQKQFYPDILTEQLFINLQQKNKNQTWAICKEPFDIKGIVYKGTAKQKRLEKYKWRSKSLTSKIDLETLAIVLQEINNDLNKSSGYLGAIGDRSKELYFNNITVGQYLYQQIKKNNHTSLKNQVFYRQDYLDEFERIWEKQSKFYPELTNKLKEEIRDVVIFYQRKLKSQKGLISICELEQKTIEIEVKNKTKKKIIGPRVVPKSSPIFQEFKIWQILNNLTFTRKNETNLFEKQNYKVTLENKKNIFNELNIKGTLKISDVFKLLKLNTKDWKCNFDTLEGNVTQQAIYNVLQKISEDQDSSFDWSKKNAFEVKEELRATLPTIGIHPNILDFDVNDDNFEQQPSYQFWHLLYSAEDDTKITEEDEKNYGKNYVNLKKKLHLKFGIPIKYTSLFTNIVLEPNYGNLSAKAIRKIIPHLQEGYDYYDASRLAGYNHSNSITRDENLKRELKDKLELLPKNSLRNPVVEKILNQLVNVVNQIIETYGKPDEIRIELARELKKSRKQREEIYKNISIATKRNEEIKKTLQTPPFNLKSPTKNDVVKYRLYQELKPLGYRTLYTDKYISPQLLFSKEIEVEHIIPKAVLYDDSFSNKTLAFRQVNLKKSKMTSYDYIDKIEHKNLEKYIQRVSDFYNGGKNKISKSKYLNLLTPLDELSDDFIQRDLKNTQYIAKKAKNILLEICREVHPTNGKITDKLRRDWDLLNIMKELNLSKYRALGLTVFEERKHGNNVEKIIDWTKRNDHRHHAMDALVVAFTSKSHIQHINTLNAESAQNSIQSVIISQNQKTKLKNKGLYVLPMSNFRTEAKKHIESILISFKTKNKVVTKNMNFEQKTLTPRGQLHEATIYGKIKSEILKDETIGGTFIIEKINTITKPEYRNLLLKRLEENHNNPKKAFAGKNSLIKKPITLSNGKEMPLKIKTKKYETIYTIRKNINPDNFKNIKAIEKVIDEKHKNILKERLTKFNGNGKEAFSNLEENPIWTNKEKRIALKRVTIKGVSSVVSLHDKKDHLGNVILDSNGKTQSVDFVNTGNNHHIAIYKDENGKLYDKVVSLFDAVTSCNLNQPVIQKNYNKDLGWEFLFSLKQNEMFLIPTNEFNPKDYDLKNTKLYSLLSKHLFYIQSISLNKYGNNIIRDFVFRHHLDSLKTKTNALKNYTYFHVKSLDDIRLIGAVKVRINHIGQIVQVGEY